MSKSTRRPALVLSGEWRRYRDRLVRELRFRDYDCALRFASLAGGIHDYGHHPDICVTQDAGGRLRLTVRNLNGAALTEQELRLAARLDAAIGEHYEWAYGEQPAVRPKREATEPLTPQGIAA